MTQPTYELIEATEWTIAQVIRTDADGTVSSIPCDTANSDYQAYLNKDKPQVEHLTEIITPTTTD